MNASGRTPHGSCKLPGRPRDAAESRPTPEIFLRPPAKRRQLTSQQQIGEMGSAKGARSTPDSEKHAMNIRNALETRAADSGSSYNDSILYSQLLTPCPLGCSHPVGAAESGL